MWFPPIANSGPSIRSAGETRGGFIYGRGTQDDKSLLAADLAVMVEIKRRNIKLGRDLILVSESDEEVGSTGIDWLAQHQFQKIDAEFAINQGGSIVETKDGPRVFRIQTIEKIPTRLILTAKGTPSSASLPRADNPIVHLSRAVVKLSDAEQPIKLNPATRAYLRELAKLSEYAWLQPLAGQKLTDRRDGSRPRRRRFARKIRNWTRCCTPRFPSRC